MVLTRSFVFKEDILIQNHRFCSLHWNHDELSELVFINFLFFLEIQIHFSDSFQIDRFHLSDHALN